MWAVRHNVVALIATVAASLAGSASARIITDFTPPSSAQIPVATPVPDYVNPSTTSPNQVVLPGNASTLSFPSLNPVDILFDVQPSAGSTTYFARELIVNNSGLAWSGFELQIGSGVGANYTFFNAFIPEENYIDFGGVNYSMAPPPTASSFAKLGGVFYREVAWSDGVVPVGGTLNLTFSVLTPGAPIGDPNPNFTLRQFPIAVPEPAAATQIALAAICIVIGLGVTHYCRQATRTPCPTTTRKRAVKRGQ